MQLKKSMSEQTEREALLESIAHWKRMCAMFIRPIDHAAESPSSTHCPLCQKYQRNDDARPLCSGCPISKAGHQSCDGTPYKTCSSMWYHYTEPGVRLPASWSEACQGEIDFLQGLLSPGKPSLTKKEERDQLLIKRSISHWERMQSYKVKLANAQDEPLAVDCPLCDEYMRSVCEGCPIESATDRLSCSGSPYPRAWCVWTSIAYGDPFTPAWKEACGAMIELLKGLLK